MFTTWCHACIHTEGVFLSLLTISLPDRVDSCLEITCASQVSWALAWISARSRNTQDFTRGLWRCNSSQVFVMLVSFSKHIKVAYRQSSCCKTHPLVPSTSILGDLFDCGSFGSRPSSSPTKLATGRARPTSELPCQPLSSYAHLSLSQPQPLAVPIYSC